MNQKICNKVLGVLNVLAFAVFFLFGLWGNNFHFGLEYPFSAMPFTNEYQNIIGFFNIIYIALILVNVFFLIQNKKIKKIIYWYIIPIVFYLSTSLTIFKINIPNSFDTVLWTVVPAIIFIINLIHEIKNKKKKKILIRNSIGLTACIIMFFVDFYTSIIWLLVSTVMLFINSKNLDDSSKVIKKLNTGAIAISILLLGIAIIRCFILVSNMQKVDDETVDFISQIKSSLIDVDKDKVLISVCKNNKWGYVNTEGKEIIPCEYDSVSREASTGSGIIKFDFYYLKKGNEYTIIKNDGKPILTRLNSPAPWITGDLQSIANEYDAELLSARVTIGEYLSNDWEYISSKTDKEIKYDDIEYTDASSTIYIFNMPNNYVLEFESKNSTDSYDEEKYLIRLKKDGRIVESYNNMSVYSMYSLPTYSNGDIPFYNLENGIHGYFSVENNSFKTIKGQFEILDVVNKDDVIIRDWRNASAPKDIIVRQGQGTILKASSIAYIGNGYLVKNDNNKIVYLDNNLNRITDEYDLIIDKYSKYGILICVNKNDDKKEFVISDLEGNILTNSPYDIIYADYDFDEMEDLDLTDTDIHSIYKKFYENYDSSKTNSNENPSELEPTKKTFNKNSPLFKITTDNYGDYIDLGKDVIKSESTADDWQILYNDTENGKLYAILADYLPTENRVFKDVGLRANYSVYSTVSREELLTGLESEKWNQLISENLKDTVKVQGAVSADILMNSYNEKHKTNFYYTSGKTKLYNEPNNESSGVDTLYVLTGVEDENNELNNEYLLNSPVLNSTSIVRIVNKEGQFETVSYRTGSGVRPVAIISYDAQIVSNSFAGKTLFRVVK